METKQTGIGVIIIKRSFMPLVIFLLLITGGFFYKINVAHLMPIIIRGSIKKFIITLLAISAGFLAQRVIDGLVLWYGESIAKATSSTLDEELLPFLRKSLKIALWIIVIITVLPFYGVNVNALIATLGVGSLAIALAAKDTISNIIAGFLIMIDRPFRMGDKVKIPSGEIVTVLDIGIRRSTFLSDEKAVIIVPNLDLSKSKIINYTYGQEKG